MKIYEKKNISSCSPLLQSSILRQTCCLGDFFQNHPSAFNTCMSNILEIKPIYILSCVYSAGFIVNIITKRRMIMATKSELVTMHLMFSSVSTFVINFPSKLAASTSDE